MVRRLLIALVAVLAFAWPAAATPLDAAPLAGVESPCQTVLCAAASSAPPPTDATACQVADLGTTSNPLGIAVDPDGCIQRFLHRAIGWTELSLQVTGAWLSNSITTPPS